MKHTHNFSLLQKFLTFVLAAGLFLFAFLIPNSWRETQRADGYKKEAVIASVSVQSIPDLPASSDSLPKISLVLFALASLWSLLLLLKALEVQENQILRKGFFLQKIQFIFISTKAP